MTTTNNTNVLYKAAVIVLIGLLLIQPLDQVFATTTSTTTAEVVSEESLLDNDGAEETQSEEAAETPDPIIEESVSDNDATSLTNAQTEPENATTSADVVSGTDKSTSSTTASSTNVSSDSNSIDDNETVAEVVSDNDQQPAVVSTTSSELPVVKDVPVVQATSTASSSAATSTLDIASSSVEILEVSEELSYRNLMSRYNDASENRSDVATEKLNQLNSDLVAFIEAESLRLEQLGLPNRQKQAYLNSLKEKRDWIVDPSARDKNFFERAVARVFGTNEVAESKIAIPDNFPGFEFDNGEDLTISDITEVEVTIGEVKKNIFERVILQVSSLFKSEQALADEASYPFIDDIATSTGPTTISISIEELAAELGHNPLNIYNYLKNNITYQPYHGALKGADGCLKDLICNDIDTAALGVALYRSSGIPARFKKVYAVVTPDQLINLMGTEDLNSAAVMASAKDDVFGFVDGVSGQTGSVLDADLSNVTQVVIETVHPQIFIPFDEDGGDFSNTAFREDVLEATSTNSLRGVLNTWNDEQWVSVDTIFTQDLTHTFPTETVPVNFDTLDWWEDFLSYQGGTSPYPKYLADVLADTGNNISNPQYQYARSIESENSVRLPITSRYLEGTVTIDGNQSTTEYFSALVTAEIPTIEYRIVDQDTDNEVFSLEIDGYEIDGVHTELYYQGATAADRATIESYGGLAETPATLVNIVPVLEFSNGIKAVGSTNLTIGQALVFETIFDNQTDDVKTVDKFSTAGNSEGIYTSFSYIEEDPLLDDDTNPDQNSLILLEGNAEIVRQFFRRLQEERQPFMDALNVMAYPIVQTGNVTQTRILQEDVNGFPTTFDFSGLSLNAYSNVVVNTRDKEDRLMNDATYLQGLALSYDEGQIFDDITGLSGIATIQGLQFAHNDPGYTVYKFTPTNRSGVNSLNLSQNTIDNLNAALDDGRTVYTPDKVVESGEWRGIVYITLDESGGSATYAIGEQVQNGGWTRDVFVFQVYNNGTNNVARYFKDVPNNYRYSFNETIEGTGTSCYISGNDIASVISSSGYVGSYGAPCYVGDTEFSDGVTRDYMLATDGARLDSTWRSVSSIRSDINAEINSYPDPDFFTFRFSPSIGTYARNFCADEAGIFGGKCDSADLGSVYYNPDQNDSYAILGNFWNKYTDNASEAARSVGYPTTDVADAADYDNGNWFDTDGNYQNFVAGQIIEQTSWNNIDVFGGIAYLPEPISDCHNSPSSCGASGGGGTGGYFGFPSEDPQKGTDNKYYQTFAGGSQIIWTPSNNNVTSDDTRTYRCEVYGSVKNRLILDLYFAHGFATSLQDTITGLYDVVAMLAVYSAENPTIIHVLTDVYNLTKDIIDLAGDIDLEEVEDVLDGVGGAIVDEWDDAKLEYDQSFGSGGCKARQQYLKGYAVGVAVETLVAAAKAGQIPKAAKAVDLDRIDADDLEDNVNAAKRIISGDRAINSASLANIENTIDRLDDNATFITVGTGRYADVRGHHPLAKVAFQGDSAYRENNAFSISSAKLDEISGIPNVHIGVITGRQNSLYRAWKNANPDATLTIDDMADIEVQAMVDAGIPEDIARGWVIRALEDLESSGVQEITNIPWGGLNITN